MVVFVLVLALILILVLVLILTVIIGVGESPLCVRHWLLGKLGGRGGQYIWEEGKGF